MSGYDGGMAHDPLELVPVSIVKVLPFRDSAAVVLEGGEKTFLIFVGLSEGAAMMRELEGRPSERPLTHDLVGYLFTAFDIEVRKIVLSSIVDGVFCATLSLAQDFGGAPREVRLDVRASDSMVIALKTGSELYATRRVLDGVEDVRSTLEGLEDGPVPSDEDDGSS